jgi:pimeloyl-ACP methyl ester carboxylesterase
MQKNYREALIAKTEVSVTQAHVTIDAMNTAYLSAGSGYPVICLHGGGAGAVTWYPSIGPLAKHFHVIAPDIVGYGESDKPDAAYDKAFFVGWLKQFLLEMGISRAHFVGLSQGGAIALQFTLDYPEMVDKLVLVDAGGLGAKSPLLSIIAMAWLNTFPSMLANRFFSHYLLFKFENRDPNHSLYSIAVLKYKGGKNAFMQGRGSAVSETRETELRKISNRTLVIWGENDRLFPIETVVNTVSMIPNAELCKIQEAGHLPLMDQPDLFNKALVDFLKGK